MPLELLRSTPEVRTARAWAAGILGGLAAAALVASAAFPPEALAAGGPLRRLGIEVRDCPGCPLCGMSRAFSSVSHGDLARAREFNPGVVVAYPLALALALAGAGVVLATWKRRA